FCTPRSTLFPYTTLFRSGQAEARPRGPHRDRGGGGLLRARCGCRLDAVALGGGESAARRAHSRVLVLRERVPTVRRALAHRAARSEEHTSELQSPDHLVC